MDPFQIATKPARAPLDSQMLEQLIYRIRVQDTEALGQLREMTRRTLFAIAHRYLRNSADAEEIVSEIYIRVWFRAHLFDVRRGSAPGWLTTMCRNAAIDALRRLRNQRRILAIEATTCSHTTEPEYLVERSQFQDRLSLALMRLPDPQRRILSLASSGLSHGEIAASRQVPLGTVKSQLSRTLKRLQRELAN